MFKKRSLPTAASTLADQKEQVVDASGRGKRLQPLVLSLSGADEVDEEDVIRIDRTKTSAKSRSMMTGATLAASSSRESTGGDTRSTNAVATKSTPGSPIQDDAPVPIDDDEETERRRAQQEEYSQEKLTEKRREMREAAEIRKRQDNNPLAVPASVTASIETRPTIISGEEAERLINASCETQQGDEVRSDDSANDEISEGPMPPPQHQSSKAAMDSNQRLREIPSSPSLSGSSDEEDDDNDNGERSQTHQTRLNELAESSPIAVLEELEVLYDHLTKRQVELKHIVAPEVAPPVSLSSSEPKIDPAQKQQILSSLLTKQKKLGELKQYCAVLSSLLKLKVFKMREIVKNHEDEEDILGLGKELKDLWSDVNDEFKNMKRILERFSWWEREDHVEFERCIGKELGEFIAPFVLQTFLLKPDMIPLQLSEEQWPFLKDALQVFSLEKTRRQVAIRAILFALQLHPVRTEAMTEAYEKLQAQASAIL